MLEVPDVPVFPSSVVTELCDGFCCGSDWDLVEPQSFSGTVTQKEMWSEEPQVKAPPISRRRVMPPTPLQNSYASFEEVQEHYEVEDQMWSARERVVIAKAKRYLEESESVKVEIEELESQLGPDETHVDFRRIHEEARDEKGCAIFETFSTDGPSAFLVVSRSRWDKDQNRLNAPWRQKFVCFVK